MIREFGTSLFATALGMLRTRAALLAENALLRQQLIVLRRAAPNTRLKARDRFAIASFSKLFPALLDAVTIVRPETVLRWHRSLWEPSLARKIEAPPTPLPSEQQGL